MLDAQRLQVFYGSSQALFGISLTVQRGEVVALLGRNGMGKTTTVRALMGLTPPKEGTIHFEGRDLRRLAPYQIARAGLGLVPEGRQIFPNLSVRENLIATQRGTDWSLAEIYTLFPRLAEREHHLGYQLSGGEQQMLAIGRALLTSPKLLILDEATEGLAPLLRQEIWQVLRRLRRDTLAILVIDSNLSEVLNTADRVYMLEKGQVVWEGQAQELAAQPQLQARYLGV